MVKQKGNNDLRKLIEQVTSVVGPKAMNSLIFYCRGDTGDFYNLSTFVKELQSLLLDKRKGKKYF